MPAGLPCGMPGMGDEIDGAMQQAPQPGRQSTAYLLGKASPGNALAPGWSPR